MDCLARFVSKGLEAGASESVLMKAEVDEPQCREGFMLGDSGR